MGVFMVIASIIFYICVFTRDEACKASTSRYVEVRRRFRDKMLLPSEVRVEVQEIVESNDIKKFKPIYKELEEIYGKNWREEFNYSGKPCYPCIGLLAAPWRVAYNLLLAKRGGVSIEGVHGYKLLGGDTAEHLYKMCEIIFRILSKDNPEYCMVLMHREIIDSVYKSVEYSKELDGGVIEWRTKNSRGEYRERTKLGEELLWM